MDLRRLLGCAELVVGWLDLVRGLIHGFCIPYTATWLGPVRGRIGLVGYP